MNKGINKVSGHVATEGSQRQGGECVFPSQSGGFAGGDAEKTPAGDYSINICIGLAPAGYLAAPDNGPWAGYRGGADKYRPASDG
jgi:hypothetical protein